MLLGFGASAFMLFPAFQALIAESIAADCFTCEWGLSQHGVGSQVIEIRLGVSYSVAPYSPHSHPPCPMLYICTGHEGWELN